MRNVQKISDAVKSIYKRTPMYPWLRDARIFWRWFFSGRPVPPPHLVKQRIVRRYGKKFQLPVFIETGTYRGDMVEAVRRDFERIYSVELGPELHRQAERRFAGDGRITILQGDSGEVLGGLLQRIDRPCLFWLDSHFSDADTARSRLITPVLRELEHILRHPLAARHVVLIDDARLFTGADDYPTLDAVRTLAADAGFGTVEVEDDVIRIRKS
jgi:hypothetical protein